jgi:hypothetical protein
MRYIETGDGGLRRTTSTLRFAIMRLSLNIARSQRAGFGSDSHHIVRVAGSIGRHDGWQHPP